MELVFQIAQRFWFDHTRMLLVHQVMDEQHLVTCTDVACDNIYLE